MLEEWTVDLGAGREVVDLLAPLDELELVQLPAASTRDRRAMTDNGMSVNGMSAERHEVSGMVDLVLEGACDLIHRNLEGVETVVIVTLMQDGSGHLCSAPAQGADLAPLLEALADGLRES